MDSNGNGIEIVAITEGSREEKRGPHPINTEALKRLVNIEGQIRGIERMVENEKYCVDILTQISAVRAALKRAGMLILKRHIRNCVSSAIKKGGSEGNEIIDDLMQVLLKEEI
jgi:CsoR family transcriptional regulator, copper-sensing transcriptional repressor